MKDIFGERQDIWHLPSGIAIPEPRMRRCIPNALWLRDYQEDQNLIDQAEEYLLSCKSVREIKDEYSHEEQEMMLAESFLDQEGDTPANRAMIEAHMQSKHESQLSR